MQINVECPFCQTRYFLQRDLVGKAMRCSTCDERFVIQEVQEAPVVLEVVEEPTPKPKPPSNPVGDLLQMLDARVAEEPMVLEPLEPFRHPPEPVREFTQPEVRLDPLNAPELPLSSAPLPERTVPEFKPPTPPRTTPAPRPATPPTVWTTPSPPTPVEMKWSDAPEPPKPNEVKWSETAIPPQPVEVKWSDAAEPPQPKEVKWSDGLPPAVQSAPSNKSETPRSDRRDRREAKRETRPARPTRPVGRPRKRRKGLLIVLILFVVGGGIGGGIWYKGYLAREPERIFAKAEKEYKENRPGPAAALFSTIDRDYPNFPRHKEAQFFFHLSTLKTDVYAITNVSDPQPAINQAKAFLTAIDNPDLKPFAAKDKFGVDVWQTLVRLADDVATKAKKEFDQDKPDETEKWIRYLESAAPVLATYRPQDGPAESVLQEIDGLKSRVASARVRLNGLNQIDQQLKDPDDDRIASARAIAKSFQIEADPAVVRRLEDAEKTIQGRLLYKRFDPPRPAQSSRDDGLTGLLFAPRIDTPSPLRRPFTGTPGVTFAVARGMLYALDESDGRVRWATRVGIDTDTIPLRVVATETQPELVLVTVNDGARSTITARLVSNGEPIWSQALESSVLGTPVQVGNRVFVSLKDPVPRPPGSDSIGIVYEIELTNGLLLGRLSLGRPLASGGVRQPGTGFVFFPAEGKSVYVFDVLKLDENGNRLDPQLAGVLNTDHPPGSLRHEPVLSASDGDAPGPRYLLLSQTEGLNEMKLRAFPLPQEGLPKGAIAPVEIKLTGWNWFAPYCDGEKLAVVTDRGEFGLFGINQAGNQDTPIFSLPLDAFKIPKADLPSRGQLIHAEEGTFWILVRGQITRIRFGLDATEGIKVNVFGTPIPVGEPIQSPQVSPRGDAFLVVTQQPNSSACLATMIEMPNGEIRWQRRLGMMTQGSPLPLGDSVFAVDQDSGLYKFDPKKLAAATDGAWLLDDTWLLAAPLTGIRSSELFPLSDGKGVVVAAQQDSESGAKLVLRTYANNEMVTRSYPLAAPLAGRPVVFGNYLLMPLATGTLFRIDLKELKSLEEGPSWRNDRLTPDAVCRLASLSDDEFIATDGNKTLLRFKWPASAGFEAKARFPWIERIESPISTIRQGERAYFSFADSKGAVTVWNAAFPVKPMRVWRGSAMSPIPVGPVTHGPMFFGGDELNLGYIVDSRSLVLLDLEKDAPLWVSARPGMIKSDGMISLPSRKGDALTMADRAGWFQLIDLKTGQYLGKPISVTGNIAPTASPLVIEGGVQLAPVSDGTLLLIRER